MTETMRIKSPTWFMVVAVVLFIWNLLGVMAYVMQVTMSPEVMAALPEEQREMYENIPSWAMAAFAIAVHGGALGCLLLILKKKILQQFF